MKTRKIKGGALALLGFLLSPLSWWNDLLINLPIAYAFAFPFGHISKNLFLPMMILGYWITNVVGLMLMHYGARKVISKGEVKYTRKKLFREIIISLVYTLIIVVLIKIEWLPFPLEIITSSK